MRIIGFFRSLAQMPQHAGRTLHRRLLLFSLVLVFLLSAVSMGSVMLFGRFSDVERSTGEKLAIQLSTYEKDITDYFDHVTARGIELSGNLSLQLEGTLESEGLAFSRLNGSRETIDRIEGALFDTLCQSLSLTDCSGVYFMLNATVNPALPDASRSKCGVYLKIANLNARRPVNPKLLLYRGSKATYDRHLEYHNMWALEYDTSVFTFFDRIMENAEPNLNKCFLYTNAFKLPGTWENVMLLCVPIMSKDGHFLGVCGFEISQLYFRLYHAQSGAIPHMTDVLARRTDSGLDMEHGLESGDKSGYFANLSGTLVSEAKEQFLIYGLEGRKFIGVEQPVRLSPLDSTHILSILIPKEDFDRAKSKNTRENFIIVALLLLSAVFGSMTMSRLYIKPVLSGFRQIMNLEPAAQTNIREIDDLFAFLARQDALREAASKQADKKQTDAHTQMSDITEAFAEFKRNVGTLSRAERKVFDLYAKGYTAAQITAELNVSMNTVKTHNKHIYEKLYVTSYKEMLVYVSLMKGGDMDEKR